MKVHNDLKELLEDYTNWFISNRRNEKSTNYQNEVSYYLSSNSLALGKPEPLAKNKQFEKRCKHKNGSLVRMAFKCDDCGEVFETK